MSKEFRKFVATLDELERKQEPVPAGGPVPVGHALLAIGRELQRRRERQATQAESEEEQEALT